MIPGTLSFETERGSIELDTDRVMANDVIFPGEYNPHHVRPWIIGNEYGALVLVWASHEQDAFDAAYDADMLAGLAVDEEHYRELCDEACADAQCHEAQCPWREDRSACSCEHSCNIPDGIMLLGNASEPADAEHAWLVEVRLTHLQERYFAEARGANADILDRI